MDTRRAKAAGAESDAGLHDRWQVEAAAAGQDPAGWLGRTLERPQPARGDITPAELVDEVAAATSTWGRADLVRAAARHAPITVGSAEASRAWIDAAAAEALACPGVVALGALELDAPEGLRRRDGRSCFERHDAAPYATVHTLEVEQQVLDMVFAGRGVGVAVVDDRDLRRAVGEAGLDGDQAAVVRAITSCGDRVSVVVGPAGAGKTRTMAAAAAAWAGSGIHVRGVAVSAMAAGVLAAETGMRCHTIAKLLAEYDRPGGPGPAWQLRRGEAVTIDEAGRCPPPTWPASSGSYAG